MNIDEKMQELADPEQIEDFSVFKEGDIFPPLKKKIYIRILGEIDYIVFLDENLHVHWYYTSNYAATDEDFAEDYGVIVSREANLEATSILLLKKKKPQLEVFRRLLGESIARVLDDRWSKDANKPNNARVMLDKAELFLRARSRERARIWYLSATLCTMLLMLIGALLVWIYRQQVMSSLNVEIAFIEVIMGMAMGSLGALISVLLRSDNIEVDVSAGRSVHYFEGTMRVLVGATAGLVFALSIKSNILLGAINRSERATTILLVITLIAGVSEQLLPSLIKQLEGTLVGQVKEVKITTTDGQEEEAEVEEGATTDVQNEARGKKKRPFFLRRRK